jgi:hypothetical protein
LSFSLNRHWREALLVLAAFVCALGAALATPVAQDLAYHDFADKRAFLGIPNFGDVMGNLAFAFVGLWGIAVSWKRRAHFLHEAELWLWLAFFAGVFFVAFGSGYYHLDPSNARLVWDRLPMTLGFMPLFAAVIAERVNYRAGIFLAPLFVLGGLWSVWYWDYTEGLGRGDLRPYAFVQFFPMIAMLLILALFRGRYTGTKYFYYTLGWYLLAKVLEHFDRGFFALTGGMVSGHTLKHLAAAAGAGAMALYISRRAPSAS